MAKMSDSIENNNWRVIPMNWNVSRLVSMNKRKQLDYFSHIQRGIVWSVRDRSGYINSILWGMPSIKMPVFSRKGDTYMCIDGKQRSFCIFDYLQDKFALRGIEDDPVYSEIEHGFVSVNNKKFSQLDESLQERILNFTFTVAVLEGTNGYEVTEEVEEEFFRRANSGKAVSKTDIAMSVAKCMDTVLDIIGDVEYDSKGRPMPYSNFFANCYGTNRFKAGTLPKEIVLKAFYLLHPERLENESNSIYVNVRKLTEISKNIIITDGEKEELKEIFNKIWNARKLVLSSRNERRKAIAKLSVGKNSLLGYIPLVHRFETAEQLAKWTIYFFGNLPEEYAEANKVSTSLKSNADTRQRVIRDSITGFLENHLYESNDYGVRTSDDFADSEDSHSIVSDTDNAGESE